MTGRNDPCPCGSGKKYKNCCLAKQAEDQTEQAKARLFFDRKYKLTRDLYSFMAQKHGGEWAFDHQKVRPFDTAEYAREGFGNMWAFFFREYDNGMRGIDWFLEERGKRYSGEDRAMLERWRAMRVSCYQLVDQYEQGAVIEDIWSAERYRMPYSETMMKLPPWTVAIGMIEPYVEGWCIHGACMWGHPDVKSEVMTRVRQLQEENGQASGRELSPADIIAGNYPEMMNLCHRVNNRDVEPVKNLEDTRERIYVTRKYTCENPEMLKNMLLDIEDDYILAPGTDPEEGKFVVSRAEKLDGIFGEIPADRRERLGLDEIHITSDLGNIVIHKQEVTISGWRSDELESTLGLLESKMASAVGLTRVDERRESHQIPKGLVSKGYNIITEKNLSEQEVVAYSNLPSLMQWIRDEQEKYPGERVEMLIRRREYEQYRINPKISNLNLLRIALGLPESPFAG